jgi:hypothetical protein
MFATVEAEVRTSTKLSIESRKTRRYRLTLQGLQASMANRMLLGVDITQVNAIGTLVQM